jgi:hypothetical protein
MATIDDLLRRIRSEYREMPGLALTAAQVQRLFGVDPDSCGPVLETLVNEHFLRMSSEGLYVLDAATTPAASRFARASWQRAHEGPRPARSTSGAA